MSEPTEQPTPPDSPTPTASCTAEQCLRDYRAAAPNRAEAGAQLTAARMHASESAGAWGGHR